MNQHGLYDIYGAWHVPFWQTKAFYIALITIALIILGLIVRVLIKRYRARKNILAIWDQVLADLNNLKNSNVATSQQGKDFYSALTMHLKKYLQGRYGMDCLSKTDDELLIFLTNNKFDPKLLEELRTIFSGSTIIKFANVQALQGQIEQDLQSSIKFIKKTIPEKKAS